MEVENTNYQDTEVYMNQLNELNGKIDLLLAEFSRSYILYKMNSTNPEYEQQYANMVANINQIQSKLFATSNNIQVNIDELSQNLIKINGLIDIERDKNTKLKKKLGMIQDKNNSAFEMIYNYKQIYNYNYLRNWGMFLSISLCILTISKVYKNQGV